MNNQIYFYIIRTKVSKMVSRKNWYENTVSTKNLEGFKNELSLAVWVRENQYAQKYSNLRVHEIESARKFSNETND